MGSPDMAFEMSDILAVNKSHEGADSGFICVTSHDRFTFKGNKNYDVCVITFAMAKDAAAEFGWKILWGQRSTGRSPEDDAPAPAPAPVTPPPGGGTPGSPRRGARCRRWCG